MEGLKAPEHTVPSAFGHVLPEFTSHFLEEKRLQEKHLKWRGPIGELEARLRGEEGKLGEGTGLTSNQFQDKDVPLGGSEMGDASSSNEEHPSQQSRSGDTLKKNNIASQGQ